MIKIIKVELPIFNAYMCLFGFIGMYIYCGGELTDKVQFLIIPMITSIIYGAYIGDRAARNL